MPSEGEAFTITTYDSHTGAFTLELPAGVSGSMDYGATTAVLTIGPVTAATLQSIAVTPANPSIAAGADPAVHRDRHVLRRHRPRT